MKQIDECIVASALALLCFGAACAPLLAGDSVYGKVTEVRSADIVVLDYGAGRYVVHLIGITPAPQRSVASQATALVTKMVLGKNARLRLGSRLDNGELVGQLLADDPATGVKDVGLELLRQGLVQRAPGEDFQFGYKYLELSKAESEARQARRGLWAANPPSR
jgi:endonuclease YncB( thermonuclease family)